jgi:antibiotic biosynthesis monooxygenase (ABM) superfamily enzyme
MFIVSVVAIYTLQLMLNLALGGLRLPTALRVALVAIAVTALMTWLVMPRLARLLQDWLYAPRRS